MLEKMNGIASHLFAAVMTLTVVTFPTPDDFLKVLTKPGEKAQKAIEIGQFPTLIAYEPPVNRILSAEDLFPIVSNCLKLPSGEFAENSPHCLRALGRLAEATGVPETLSRIRHNQISVQLAAAYFCRAQWAHAAEKGVAFDAETCLSAHQVVESRYP